MQGGLPAHSVLTAGALDQGTGEPLLPQRGLQRPQGLSLCHSSSLGLLSLPSPQSGDLFPRQAEYLPENGAGSLLPSPWKQMTNARWQMHKAKCSQITALAAGTYLQSHCWADKCELISTVMVLAVSWWPVWGKSFAGTTAMFLASWGEACLPAALSIHQSKPHTEQMLSVVVCRQCCFSAVPWNPARKCISQLSHRVLQPIFVA